MMLLSVKKCLPLLWGASVLFVMVIRSNTIPVTSTDDITTELNEANAPPATAHVPQSETQTQHADQNLADEPTDVNVIASAVTTVSASASMEKDVAVVSNSTTTSSSTGLQLPTTPAAVTTVAEEVKPSQSATVSDISTPTPIASAAPATISTPSSATQAPSANTSDTAVHSHFINTPSPSTTPKTKASPSTVTSSSSYEPIVTTQLSFSTTQTPHVITTLSRSPTTTASSAASTTSSTKPDVTTELSSNATQTPHPIINPSPSATTTVKHHTTKVAPVSDTTSVKSTISTVASSSSQPAAETRPHTNLTVTESNSTTMSPNTTAATNSSTILIPHVPKRLPLPTISSSPTTVKTLAPTDPVQPCSTLGLAKQCLIAIAALALLATIFMVSTIILCTKLSTRKYKLKKPKETEMMCISSLFPERTYNYTRQRSRVPNGVLVIPTGDDSDDEVGDNLTLSSFLPETERNV